MKTIAQQIKWNFETNGSLRIRDKRGNLIYHEDSDGGWYKYEYDSQGNQIYYEDSSGHVIYNTQVLRGRGNHNRRCKI